MSYTASDQINRALRLLGILAEGESPSADMSNDALVALNQMIDSWSIEKLSTYATQDQQFNWTAGTISRTLGPTGNFMGNRPIAMDDSTYFVVNSISYPIALVNQEQYNDIALKTVQSSIPQMLYVSLDFPNVTMYMYPVPSQTLAMHFVSVTELSQPATLATTLSFPPGYMRAFAYNLACEFAPEFGVEAPRDVKRIADISKRNLKRINNPEDVMSFPDAIVRSTPYSNIFTG